MLGPIGSFFKSFFLPSHYAWAAHKRTGIGLSYVFAISIIAVAGFTLYMHLAASEQGMDLKKLILLVDVMGFSEKFFARIADDYGIAAAYGAYVVLAGLMITFLIINLAIVLAVIGQVPNALFGAHLDFAALLRITSYAAVAGVSLVLAVDLTTTGTSYEITDNFLQKCIIFGLLGFYTLFGVAAARGMAYAYKGKQ